MLSIFRQTKLKSETRGQNRMSYAMQGSLTRGGGYQPQVEIPQPPGEADTMMWQQQHYMGPDSGI